MLAQSQTHLILKSLMHMIPSSNGRDVRYSDCTYLLRYQSLKFQAIRTQGSVHWNCRWRGVVKFELFSGCSGLITGKPVWFISRDSAMCREQIHLAQSSSCLSHHQQHIINASYYILTSANMRLAIFSTADATGCKKTKKKCTQT